ncbi:MAG: 4-(cytidine 5'-diphospho)-2-C-methyl-D-erythritol kinase [Actinomycetota bacterium]|nr:4-(cytidine 5'-diphospho)-2-C-methyl-D-erythritol kinase [Actinomycetota bacterium]
MSEASTGREVRIEARAKVNLFLRVLRRRDDGYHDLESLVVPVSLHDTVTVRARSKLSVEMRAAGSFEWEVIDPDHNLALIAAREWVAARGRPTEGAAVTVEKAIPVAAGLGGGSADAAAVLRAMNELWGRPFGDEELCAIGARVGSDVPALLTDGPVVMRGRGEIVEPARVAGLWFVVVPQPIPVSTADAYRWWDEDGGTTGPDAAPLLLAAAAGDVDALAGLMFNDLQGPVVRRHPQLEEVRANLLRAGALGAILCGSGPTMAGLARDEAHAHAIAARVPSAIPVSGPG